MSSLGVSKAMVFFGASCPVLLGAHDFLPCGLASVSYLLGMAAPWRCPSPALLEDP